MKESTAQPESLSAAKLELARELLDDIELSRHPPESLLLKVSRLARLTGEADIQEWFGLELNSYRNLETPVAKKYALLTGRSVEGIWNSFSYLISSSEAMKAEMNVLRVPDIHLNLPEASGSEGHFAYYPSMSRPWVWRGPEDQISKATQPARTVIERMASLTGKVALYRAIVSRVIGLLHNFVSSRYHALAFTGLAESVFEGYRKSVDSLLASRSPKGFEKIPAIADRLAAGDPEAVSHAMDTGRRILASVADAVVPPTNEKLILDGKEVNATEKESMNRLYFFVQQHCKSNSREERIRRTLRSLYERFCASVHADITSEDAKTLFLQLYITLGEILSLGGAESLVA